MAITKKFFNNIVDNLYQDGGVMKKVFNVALDAAEKYPFTPKQRKAIAKGTRKEIAWLVEDLNLGKALIAEYVEILPAVCVKFLAARFAEAAKRQEEKSRKGVVWHYADSSVADEVDDANPFAVLKGLVK